MLRGAVSRSALIVGVLALLGGAVLGGRMLSGAPDPAGVDGEVLEVGPKLRPSAEEPEPDAGSDPYQPPVQAQRPAQEEPKEAPGHRPAQGDWDSGEPDPDTWDDDDWDEEDQDD